MAEELEEYFNRELAPSLRELEAKRSALIRSVVIVGVVVAAAALLTLVFLPPVAALAPVMVGGLFLMFSVRPKLCDLNHTYKFIVYNRLVASFGEGFDYRQSGGISRDEFENSRLFHLEPNRYASEDLVVGKLGETELKFAEIRARRETGSGKNRRVVTVFSGVFFVADFHKDFHAATWVLPDVAERSFGKWIGGMLQKANFSQAGELVRLEDPEFERLFAVYSLDPVEARYILSPSLMERMVALRGRFPGNVSFAFIRSKVVIAISTDQNLFEAPGSGWKSYLDFEPVRCNYRWLVQLVGIVEQLTLNRRVWSKE